MCFCLTFLAVSLTVVYLSPLAKGIFSLLFLVLAILNLILGKCLHPKLYQSPGIRYAVTVLLLCGFAAGCLSLYAFDHYAAGFSRVANKEDTVTLSVTETVYTSSYNARYFAVVKDSTLLDEEILILLDTLDISVLPGDLLRGSVVYHTLEEDVNGFNERQYALTRKIFLTAEDTSLRYIGREEDLSLTRRLAQLNDSLCHTLEKATEESGLAAALLLGDRSGLSDTMRRDFRRLGIYHILSLSGAHLSILSAMMEKCLLKLKVKKQIRAVLIIVAVLFFMALTGFSAALTRAGIMLILAQLAYLIKKKSDYQTALTFACACIIAVNPYAVMDWGLQLSFAASQSCYISATLSHRFVSLFTLKSNTLPKVLRRMCNRLIRYVAGMVVFNTVITVNMLPLMWLYFGELSLFSLPANLIYIPLITLLMYLSLALLLLSPVLVSVAPLANAICTLTDFIRETSEYFSSLSGVVISLDHWFTPIFLIPILLASILSFGSGRKHLRRIMRVNLILFLCFLTTWGAAAVSEYPHTYTEYVSRAKNDGILVKSEGKLLICEVSTGSYSFASLLTDRTSHLHCTEIQVYMLTHYHNYQINAFQRLTDKYIIRSLALPIPVTEAERSVYDSLTDIAVKKGIEVLLIDQPSGIFSFGEAEIQTYPRTILTRSSHPIVAVEISSEDTSLMYLGGSFNEGDPRILRHAEEADYLIFGGHSPIYKKAFDLPSLREAKTVYVSDYVIRELMKLCPDEVFSEGGNTLCPEKVFRLDP